MPHSLKHSLPDDEQDAFYVVSPLSPSTKISIPTPSHTPMFHTEEKGRVKESGNIHSWKGLEGVVSLDVEEKIDPATHEIGQTTGWKRIVLDLLAPEAQEERRMER
ncbi:hypothetical protein CDAR_386401 [Caerostris darwini]|uniref:Uncharacterized protein n=1 Tax=Caerostris darwini TaxID=1538125 RepID=A0AAV4QCS0_9ARAC|nr:hypothetical protein CDAR_386401 [Caerostris darwini]